MLAFATTLLAQAEERINLKPGGDFSGLDFSIPQLITSGIQLIFIVAAVVFFFMLVIGGIRWIISGGDKGQTEAARNQITAALVGLVIVFAAWAIVQLLSTFFNINIFTEGVLIPQVGK